MRARVLFMVLIAALGMMVVPTVFVGSTTDSGEGPAAKASEPPVDLAILVALNRMEAAERRLELVRKRAEEGLASPGDVKDAEHRYDEAMKALAEVTGKSGRAGPRVTVEIKDMTLEDALRAIFKDTDQSVVVQSGIIVGALVNLSLKNVPLEEAVKAITELNGLDYNRTGSVWVVSQKEGVLTIGGVKVPVVGIPEGAALANEIARLTGKVTVGESGVVSETPPSVERYKVMPPTTVKFPGSETLVDLDVKNVPLSEVANRLSHRLPPIKLADLSNNRLIDYSRNGVGSLEIIVDDSVEDQRVTASIRKWPLGKVLDMLIDQANLVCSSEEIPSDMPMTLSSKDNPEEIIVHARTTKIYLVPKPVLEVTGASVGTIK